MPSALNRDDGRGTRPADGPTPAALPSLLRTAAHTYGGAIETALEASGYGDLPRTGYRVIGPLVRGPLSIQELADRLRMSKQGVGRLSDALVDRGFVTRQDYPADRRRVLLELTDRGRAAAGVGREVIERINRELARRMSPASIEVTRRTLLGLIEIGRDATSPEPSDVGRDAASPEPQEIGRGAIEPTHGGPRDSSSELF